MVTRRSSLCSSSPGEHELEETQRRDLLPGALLEQVRQTPLATVDERLAEIWPLDSHSRQLRRPLRLLLRCRILGHSRGKPHLLQGRPFVRLILVLPCHEIRLGGCGSDPSCSIAFVSLSSTYAEKPLQQGIESPSVAPLDLFICR